MHRRDFIQSAGLATGAVLVSGTSAVGGMVPPGQPPWFNRSMRWAQLAFVDTDPARCDPDFWLSYFKTIHADGALLSAGGVTAFYPTQIPLHHRSEYLGNSDLL